MADAKGIWMLTTSFNDYDQHGAVPCCIWPEKPTIEELEVYFKRNIVSPHGIEKLVSHVHEGGGRHGTEYQWYDLDFVPFGEDIR